MFGKRNIMKRMVEESVEELHEQMRDEYNEQRMQYSKLNEQKIPSPPEWTDSGLLDYIKVNLAYFDPYAPAVFSGYVLGRMKEEDRTELSIRIDKDRTLTVRDNRAMYDGFECVIELVDKRENVTVQLLGADGGTEIDFTKTLKELVSELDIDEQNVDFAKYKYRTWDTAYLTLTNEEKVEAINHVYYEMKRSGLFTPSQLIELYKIMYRNNDINCFACPFYPAANIWRLESDYERDKTPKHAQLLRDFNKFCSDNFSERFTESQFTSLYHLGLNNKLQTEFSSQNFQAQFKFFYYLDMAKHSPEHICRFEIGDKSFVIRFTPYSEASEPDYIEEFELVEEIIESNGQKREKFIWHARSDKDFEDGSLDYYFQAYNAKAEKSTSTAELLKGYMKKGQHGETVRLKVENDKEIVFDKKGFIEDGRKKMAARIRLFDKDGNIEKTFVDVTIDKNGHPTVINKFNELVKYYKSWEQ